MSCQLCSASIVYVSPHAWAAVGKRSCNTLQAHAGSCCKVLFLLSVYGTTGLPGIVPCDMYVLQTWFTGRRACTGGFCTDTGRVATLNLVEHRHVQAESTPVHQSKSRAVSATLRMTLASTTCSQSRYRCKATGGSADHLCCLRHELKTQIQDPSVERRHMSRGLRSPTLPFASGR